MAAIGESIIAKLLEEAYALLKDEVVSLSGAASEIERLEDTFRSIQLVLADADRRRSQNKAVNKWLRDLKDLMYDADDVLDECRVKAENYKLLSSTSRFRFSPLPYIHKITWGYQIKRRIQNLNARMGEIISERSKFGFITEFTSSPPQISRKTSHLTDPNIVGLGIEEDTSNLVELLTKNGQHDKSCVRAIVGIGGIGKTTLAQKIYNDDRITAHFIIKLWVSVTQDFTDMDLLRSIGKQLHVGTDLIAPNVSKECLMPEIKCKVVGRRFIIVLDDVWNKGVWCELLQSPLQGGAPGCQVLITTRNMEVAEKIGAVDICMVQLMSHVDGWALLRKVAFNGKEEEIESLQDIGMEIVKKCAGLPLAIKAISGVICNKAKRRRDWEAILHNSNWSVTGLPEGVHAALYLSYEDLPSHLKECFLYICLFPLAPFLNKQSLIQYWIAEGFIKIQVGQTLEESGEECYLDLLRRGLIQPDHLSYDSDTCRVHNLLQTLAQFLAQSESLVQVQYKSWITRDTSEGSGSFIPMKCRRLSSRISNGEMKPMLDFAQKDTHLRTLLLRSSKMDDEDLQYLVNTATRLRVLDFRWSSINKLPEFMGFLIHLRLLVLTDTTITEIPESIGDLVSLQFLWIQGCENLCKLPKGILKLKKLRCLDLYDNKIEGIPQGIDQLKNLNILQGFVTNIDKFGVSGNISHQVSSLNNWSTLKEVRVLTNLRRLTIHKLERLFQEVTIGESVLRDMPRLEFLELEIKRRGDDDEEIEKIGDIFGVVLLPPSTIEILIIKGFFGRMLPSWFMLNNISSFFPNLRRLELYNCDFLEKLPPFGMLPNLDYLEVARASKIKIIGNEFLGQSSSNPFPMLTTLIFSIMHNWVEWDWDTSGNGPTAFPHLQSLELDYCISLKSLPSELCGNHVPLKRLNLNQCLKLREISGFPLVRKLVLLNGFSPFYGFPRLEVIVLEDEYMNSLPQWISQAPPTLRKLFIFASFELLQKCFRDGSDWPKIQYIPYVHVQDRNHYVCKSPCSYSTGTGCSSYSESLRMPRQTYCKPDYLSRNWGDLK